MIMKKILYALIAVLLTAAACSRSEFSPVLEEQDGKVTFIMGTTFPEPIVATKANGLADNPQIESVHVAVFGGEGYLNDYVLGIPCDVNGNILPDGYGEIENDQVFYFRVSLNATTSKCSVHIIVNGPSQMDYQTKVADIMLNKTTSLTTTESGVGGYWAFFDLPSGNATFNSSGVYVANSDATTAFSNVNLIRNFARFLVTEKLDNFELEGFNIYNYPTNGFFSIWDGVTYALDDKGRPSDNPQFISDYHTYRLFDSTEDDEYDADKDITLKYPTPYVSNVIQFNESVPTTTQTYNKNTKYVFERSKGDDTHAKPYIIIKGKYTEDGTQYPSSYYRIELTNEDGVYVPIYRNFDYTINLLSVSKNGISDPARTIASNGNVTASIGASIPEVSNGAGRLMVSYTERTFVKTIKTEGDDGGESGEVDPGVIFQYGFIPDVFNAPGTYKGATLSTPTPAVGGAIKSVGTDWGTASTTDWTTVHFYLDDPDKDGKIKESTFTVTGVDVNNKKLYRTITVKLLPIQEFKSYSFNPNGSAAGSEVCLNLKFPEDLPESMFPIRLVFEDSARLLSPRGQDMPVETDVPSIVPGKTGTNYYHFVKEVSSADYNTAMEQTGDAKGIIACRFKRIDGGATTLYVQDKNGYFKPINISTSN